MKTKKVYKVYEGQRLYPGACGLHGKKITVNEAPLNPRLDLAQWSPTGLEWGYGGSGPRQLALAILADYLEDGEVALILCIPFENAVIRNLPRAYFKLTGDDIEKALVSIRSELS